MRLGDLYRHSLALLTDLYQLTMAYAYWSSGLADREAVFHLTFRENPFGGGYAIACGLSYVIDWLRDLRFTDTDIGYLAELRGADDQRLFEPRFLQDLQALRFHCSVDALPEGTIVFPHEPLLRVQGPLLQCQLVETGLLNMVNFQTLLATKASRICRATRGEPVLEFGLRRAQGIDGGITASRAAFIGGCAATSNVLAGKLFDIPVRGTHAHSWVMSFDDELASFQAYADTMPGNCVFLVDTFDTIDGVKNAIAAGQRLRDRGFELSGIRLDSGDLVDLSITARQMLDEAGLNNAAIVASSDLDEFQIERMKQDGATINVWGVGTRLATAYDQPALGGIYKLSALRDALGNWQHKIKLSNQALKVSTPGILQVRRFFNERRFIGDAIYDELTGIEDDSILVDQTTGTPFQPPSCTRHEDLLVRVFQDGVLVYNEPTTRQSKERTLAQLEGLADPIKNLTQPPSYPVRLERRLHDLKQELVSGLRGTSK